MDEHMASSDRRPVSILTGPTVTLYRRDIRQETTEGEDGEPRTYYTYTEIRFERGEYDLVRSGMLPPGVREWTDDLRRIERSALLDNADILISEANDNITTEQDQATVEAWTAYRTAMREYKMAVRATITQSGFPASVEYPELPTI